MKAQFSARWVLALGFICSATAQQQPVPDPKPKEPVCKKKDIACQTIVATRQLLKDYEEAIKKQISTTKKAYANIAQAAEQGRRDEIDIGLRNQRNRRSEMMADAFIQRVRPVSQWKEHLLEYAVEDFAMNRELLELESTDGGRFLEGVKSLEVEVGKVRALDKLLAGLNEKQTLLDQLGEIGAFGKETDAQFDKLVCAGLKTSLTEKQAALKAADTAIATLTAAPASAQQAADLAKKKDEKTALTGAVATLEKQRAAKKCTD